METFNEVLRWAQNVVFVAVGLWALREWRRRQSTQAGWLAATFGSLAVVVLVGVYTDAVEESTTTQVIGLFNLAVIAFFPYLLLRFLHTFEPQKRGLLRAAFAGSAVVAVGGLALFNQLPAEGEGWSPIVTAWILAFVLDWFIVLALVGWRFWRGGSGQPTLARRRLRLLAVGSVLLGLVLLIAGAAGGDPSQTVTLVTRVIGLASAVLFLVGFAPPGTLRSAWRQPEEQQLHAASLRLMAATSREEVGEILAPHITTVIGAQSTAIVDHQQVVGFAGMALPEARAAALVEDHGPDAMLVPLTHGRIVVWTNRYTPFFGTEEITLLRRLALLADLALDRTSLLAAERSARHELELTNKELESFVYTASHDLKSPLIAMLGYLEVIETEYRDKLGDEADWYVERMLTNGRYMEALIGDLLELSRVGRMQTDPEVIDLHQLVEGLAVELGGRYPQVTFEVGDLPRVWINGTRARQLLGNLLENAAKYGGDGLTVHIGSRGLTDGGVELQVRDDGVGIPDAYAEKVFGVFERLDPDDTKSGTGIGLAICRKIVESCGGDIWLAPSDDGADFRIRFPADVVRDAPEVPASPEEITA